jgi:DNA-binding MarR family transcriptional regulator
MNYKLIKDVIGLVENFNQSNVSKEYTENLDGFKRWISNTEEIQNDFKIKPNWEGMDKGRSPESAIATLIVHMNRYGKTYSKSAIHESGFSTQEDFIYLINLRAFGAMTKTDLIKKNIHDKPVGMQIINRLINQGWIEQRNSFEDKRSKIILITEKGIAELDKTMEKIKQATHIVSGNLSYNEKIQLIALLQKLDNFHRPIYDKNFGTSELIDAVFNQHLIHKN